MPTIDFTQREVRLKIAFHGPVGSGRATTMAKIHGDSPASKGGLAIPAGEREKSFSFSFSAGEPSLFEGFSTRFEFHSLSGPLPAEATAALLRDADGIVLVADSQWEKLEEDVKSLQEIEEALKADGLELSGFPFVLQYNKRDLPDVAPGNYLDFLVNNRPAPAPTFETVATTGENLPALRQAIMERVLARFAEEYGEKAAPPLLAA